MNSGRAGIAGFSDEPDFKLGEWWVRPQRNELERGDEVAHVEARSMEVLVCLARHAPRVVGKQRLLDEVWSESRFVGEEVISHAIWELRRVLGDSARDPGYIKTVPRRGYVLLAEVVRPEGSPLPLAGVRIDHYDIGEEIGRGSMGVVFKAFDRRLERNVAIKFLAPELTRDREACRRFQREAQVAASLDHPNLATIHAIGETSEGQHYLVTPYYSGGSLKEVCAGGELSIDGAVRFAHQLARGLAAAHAQGIVHRDIKPANLLLDEHGTLKIADFGIAKLLGATDLTHTGISLGTPAYKSPEQAQGRPVDHRSDLWSFGVVLFELLTGRRPFDGEYELAVVHSILSSEPSAETDPKGKPIPEALRRVVAKAMAKEPEERYQSAEEVAGELDALDGAGLGSDRPPVSGRPSSVRIPAGGEGWSRGRGIRAAAVVLGLLLLLIAAYAVRDAGVEEPPPEARDALAQASALWLRGNDRRNLEEVEKHLSLALRLAPNWAEASGLLAVLKTDTYALTKVEALRQEAEELIERARGGDRSSALASVAQARLFLIQGDYQAAEAAARRAIELWPSCSRGENCDLAYLMLAEALWGQERADEAFQTLSQGLDRGGGNIRCRLKRAQLYQLRGDLPNAAVDYNAVLEQDYAQSTALNELGLLYLETREFEKAAALFRRLYDKTRDPRVLLNLGNALYEQRRWQEAITAYEQALDGYAQLGWSPELPALALGDTYLELGQPARAREYFARALEAFDALMAGPDPGLWVRGVRAVCLAKLDRLDEAREEIDSLTTHRTEFPAIWSYAARVLALARDREGLLALAREATAAGVPAAALLNDAAFIAYREDPEYRAVLEPRPAPAD